MVWNWAWIVWKQNVTRYIAGTKFFQRYYLKDVDTNRRCTMYFEWWVKFITWITSDHVVFLQKSFRLNDSKYHTSIPSFLLFRSAKAVKAITGFKMFLIMPGIGQFLFFVQLNKYLEDKQEQNNSCKVVNFFFAIFAKVVFSRPLQPAVALNLPPCGPS